MLLVLSHHGHPVDGVGDGVLDTGLDVGSHNERSSKSMVSLSFCLDDVCELRTRNRLSLWLRTTPVSPKVVSSSFACSSLAAPQDHEEAPVIEDDTVKCELLVTSLS